MKFSLKTCCDPINNKRELEKIMYPQSIINGIFEEKRHKIRLYISNSDAVV